MPTTGIQVFLDLLHRYGIDTIFGNPGTTELPLNDALIDDPRFHYHLALHEIPVVAMADGYAQASGRMACVNLHTCCGLGNAMGMIYNAQQAGTPLLITAGQQDRRLQRSEPVLAGDMVSVAKPWTKFAAEVEHVDDLPWLLKRAVQAALTPPRGPVFLSLPLDLQRESCEFRDTHRTALTQPTLSPDPEAIRASAACLAQSRRPVILAGSRVQEEGGTTALETLAELWGAPIFYEGATSHGRLPAHPRHPWVAGPLALWSPEIAQQLQPFDTVLACGINLFRLYIHFEPEWPLPISTRVIQIDSSVGELGKNSAPDVAVWTALRPGLEQLVEASREAQRTLPDGPWTHNDRAFAAKIQTQRRTDAAAFRAELAERGTLTSEGMMQVIADWAPPDLAVVEEAVTSTHHALERLGALQRADGYFAHRGWALGWGSGLACGVQFAWPDRPVLAILGDGAFSYGLQALWTAAHEKLPVTFLIADNQQYRILKDGARLLRLPHAEQHQFLGMDLNTPALDFVALAQGFGVSAERVETAEALAHALARRPGAQTPALIEVRLHEPTP